MQFDVPADPELFVSLYRHIVKSKLMLWWICFAISVLMAAISILCAFLFKGSSFRRYFIIALFLCCYCVFVIYSVKKHMRVTGETQARLCGDHLHYEVTEEGVLCSAQDGYGFHPFAYLFRVTVYPDMWLLRFGDKSAPTVVYVFKSAFPNTAEQASFEALLKEKLAGKPMLYKN